MRVLDRFRVRIELAATPNGSPSLRRRRPATEALRIDAADWWIATRPRSAPSASVAGRFDPTARPSLEGSAVDMVIVTDESLRAPFDALADWRTRTGTRTVVRTVDWILANYSGSDVAERIRLFLRDAYVSWGTQYALLGGDTEFIPVRYARSFYGSPAGADVATDFYYACLDGDWNADGDAALGEVTDAVDFQPDIYVGRLPASSVAEATTMTNKVMWYHGADPARFDDTYQETISFWAEALFWPTDTPSWNGNCAAVGFDGARIANWAYQNYVPSRFYPSTNLFYETHACWSDTNYVPLAESRASVIADFNSGRHLVVHIGHGFRNIMAVGASNQQLFNADADAFTNGDRLSIVYAVNCNSGAVDFDAIGEHLLTNDQLNGNGGAVAVIAATDLDYPATSEDHLFAFFQNGFSDSSVSVPVGEEFFETTRQIYSPFAANADNAQRWTSYSLILLADPSMRVWSTLPSRFQVFAESFYEMGAGPFQVTVWEQGSATPVPDARITIYKEDDVFVSALTNASGVASLDFQPSSLEGFSIGVTKDNYVPFTQDAVVVAPLAAPALTVDGFTVDDATGNQNGTADRAESVSLAFDVSNVGTATATNVALSVSTTSPFASVTQPNGTVGTLGTGASGAATPVTLAVSAALPDSMSFVSIPVTVAVTSDQGNVTVVRTLVAGNPRLVHAAFRVVEVGDGNGTVDVGETGKVVVAAFNRGQGSLLNGRASLSAASAAVSVTDGDAPIAPTPSMLAESDTLTFDVVGAGALLFDLSYVDDGGTLLTRPIELEAPDVPAGLVSKSGPGAISLSWDPVGTPDAAGYNVYRVDALSRALTRVNGPPTPGAFFTDIGLTPLSPFSYTVTSVDSAGNESAFSDTISASTSPPTVGGFPLTLQGGVNRGSVTFVDLDQDEGLYELVLGSSYLTVVRGDATEYIDGDDRPATVGVFSEVGFVDDPSGNPFFWAKPAVADVDGDDVLEIIAVHFKTGELYCWDATGTLEWGGPSHDIGEVVWSSPAIGNIDDDPEFEIVLWTGSFRTTDPYRGCIIAFNHDGTEVLDGDGSGATNGVLWKSPNAESEFNYSSVALADLDGDGRDEIVAGEKFDTNGQLHVLDLFGGVVSEMPGWPYDPNPAAEIDQFSASPALADVDGDGALEIFAVYLRGLVGMEIDGTPIQHMGSPVYPKPYTGSSQADFNDFLPSPVIGDFDGDGELDVVHGWHSGQVYAYTAATGVPLPGWPVTVPLTGSSFDRCLFNGSLANVDGDPEPEFVCGSGGGNIVAVNADGSLVGGFPSDSATPSTGRRACGT